MKPHPINIVHNLCYILADRLTIALFNMYRFNFDKPDPHVLKALDRASNQHSYAILQVKDISVMDDEIVVKFVNVSNTPALFADLKERITQQELSQ